MKNRWKRIVAFVMMLTLMFSNTGWSAIPYVKAEPTEETITEEPVEVEEPQKEEATTQQATTQQATTQEVTTEAPTPEITIPTVKINGAAVSGELTWKKDKAVTISSDDCSDEKWQVKIFDKNDVEKPIRKDNNPQGEIIPRLLKDGTSFKLEDGKNTIKFFYDGEEQSSMEMVINGFTEYIFNVTVGDASCKVPQGDVTLENTNWSNVTMGSTYKVTSIKGFTLSDDKPEIKLTDTEQKINVTADSVTVPKVNSINKKSYINKTISLLSENHLDVNYNIWIGKYKLNDRPEEVIPNNDGHHVVLSENGKYSFYFECAGMKSNIITTEAYSKVEFSDDEEEKDNLTITNKIYYTGRSKIELVCDLNSSDIVLKGHDNSNLSKSKYDGYQLILEGDIQNDDFSVGERTRTIKITNAKVKKGESENLYFETTSLKDKTIKVNFEILKPDLLIRPIDDSFMISYRTNDIRWDETVYNVFYVMKDEGKSTDEQVVYNEVLADKTLYRQIIEETNLSTKIVTVQLDSENTVKRAQIQGLSKETNPQYYMCDLENYRLLFENDNYAFKTISEKINIIRIQDVIQMFYTEKELALKSDCVNDNCRVGGNSIVAQHKGNIYKESYPDIYFRKQSSEKVTDRDIIDIKSETNPVSKDIKVKFENGGAVAYYDIIFSDTDGIYPAVAAVVRIVKESSLEGNNRPNLSNTIEDTNGRTYQVINLFYDDRETNVDFENDELETTAQRDITAEKYICTGSADIVFSLDIDAEGSTVEYGYVDLENVNERSIENYVDIEKYSEEYEETPWEKWGITTLSKATLVEKEEDDDKPTYCVPAPSKEGNYALFMKITNEVANSQYYISNGLVIDTTAPTITTAFYDSNNVKFDCPTEKKDRKYLPNGWATMDIVLKDKHTCEAEFIVTVTDKDGKQLPSQEEYYLLKTDPYIPEEEGEDEAPVRKTYRLVFNKNANYSVRVDAKDFSGNHSNTATYYLTVDNEKPTGTILVNGFGKENMWTSLMNAITYKLFNKKTATFELEGEDRVSPVACYYYIAEEIDEPLKEKDFTENDEIKWEEYKGKVTIPADKREVVYGKIVDKAGNTTYISTDGLLTDTKAPVVTYTVDKESNEKGFYNSDVTYKVKVEEISNVVDGSISGLQKISYKILSDNKTTKEETIYENKSETIGTNDREFKIPVKAADNNNNDVKIMIEVTDMAGNEVKESIKLQIDDKPPTIDVTYDNNNIINGKYYNRERTATITIKERNLDVKNDVTMYARGKDGRVVKIPQLKPEKDEDKSDERKYKSTFTFAEDDDYEFFVTCTDKAGNKATKQWKEEFTLDTTAPIIDVSYSGKTVEEDGYYKDAVTATITITEHNFDASKADINITQPDGTSIGASDFRSDGDKHTASVAFNQDGTYSLDVAFTDEAGNNATSHEGSTFHVDLKEPVIEIANVKDKSANKGDVKPVITCTDENYDKNKVTISVKGANSGDINLEKLGLATKAIANGEEFSLTFPKEEAMDDIYTLTAKMEDKAGNEKEESVQFSINRYGSVYTLADETGEWLTNGVCSYIQEGRDVVIIETNVDEVVERNISYTAGGIDAETIEVKELEGCSSEEKSQGTYFKTRKLNSGNDWYQYQYTIQADNFANEGRYSVQIDSKDKAGNHTSNASNKHSNSNLDIQFAVDQTAPSAVVTGTENGGIYEEESRTVMLDVQDNMALKEVTVFLNGDAYATYDAEQIAKQDDGLIPVKVEESFTTQTIQLQATDMAGNVLGEDADGTYDKTFEDFNLIVTQNIIVQMLYTYWAVILVGIAGVTGAIAFLVVRRKKRV